MSRPTPIALIAFIALASTGPALSQDGEIGMEIFDWDGDADGRLAQDEFLQGWGELDVFGNWDEDDSGDVSHEEFDRGVFDAYDDDGDGVIDETEFEELRRDLADGGVWGA